MQVPHQTQHCDRNPAFTLIELIVVIAIVGLLLTIIVPAMSAARRRAKQTQCFANIRSMAAAMMNYSVDDASGQLIPALPIADIDTQHDEGFFDFGGGDGLDAIGGQFPYGHNGMRIARKRPLNVVLFKSDASSSDFGVFRCPTDSGLPGSFDEVAEPFGSPLMTKRTFFECFGTSYGANAYRSVHAGKTGSEYSSAGVFLHSASVIPAPSQTVLLYEGIAWYNLMYKSEGHGAVFSRGLQGWHGSKSQYSFAFVDGHADMTSMPSGQLQDPAVTTPWKHGEPLQIRGRGFRFDSFPATPVLDLPNP